MIPFDALPTRSWHPFRAFLHPYPDLTPASQRRPHSGSFETLHPSGSGPPDLGPQHYPMWTSFCYSYRAHRRQRAFLHHLDRGSHRHENGWHAGYEAPLGALPEDVHPLFPFQWSFNDADALRRHEEFDVRPVSPLDRVGEPGNENETAGYQPGYAETIVEEDGDGGREHPENQPWCNIEESSPSFAFEKPETPTLKTERDLAMRWHALSAREEELAVRETTLKEAIMQLEHDRDAVQLREHEVCRQQFELLMEKQQFDEQRRRQRPPFTRANWNWHDVWAGEMDWENEWDGLEMREGEVDEGISGPWLPQWEDGRIP